MKSQDNSEIYFKIAFLFLLIVICGFLWRIHSQLSSIPRFGDRYEEAGKARPSGVSDSMWNVPVIEVQGGEIKLENRYPIEVKISDQ